MTVMQEVYFINEPFDGEVPSIMGRSRLYQKPDPELPGLEESARPEPSRPRRARKPPKPDGIPF
jgi:hypothetical protein